MLHMYICTEIHLDNVDISHHAQCIHISTQCNLPKKSSWCFYFFKMVSSWWL